MQGSADLVTFSSFCNRFFPPAESGSLRGSNFLGLLFCLMSFEIPKHDQTHGNLKLYPVRGLLLVKSCGYQPCCYYLILSFLSAFLVPKFHLFCRWGLEIDAPPSPLRMRPGALWYEGDPRLHLPPRRPLRTSILLNLPPSLSIVRPFSLFL